MFVSVLMPAILAFLGFCAQTKAFIDLFCARNSAEKETAFDLEVTVNEQKIHRLLLRKTGLSVSLPLRPSHSALSAVAEDGEGGPQPIGAHNQQYSSLAFVKHNI